MFRKIHAFWLAAVVATVGGVVLQAPPAFAKTLSLGYQASAYGTSVAVGSTVKSGRSALAVLGCTTQAGITHTNTAASVSVPPALTAGAINTSAASVSNADGAAATSAGDVESASLLGGLVSATTVRSVSTSARNRGTGAFSVSADGTQFVGLTVAGVPISGTPAPNTKLTLPGVGYVVLDQQTSHVRANSATLTVIGIHLVVTLSTPLAPIGTQIRVGFATSALGGPVKGLLTGLAYGANASLASTVIAGKAFPQPLACLGTRGRTKTNSGASITVPGVLSSGTVTDTAEGVANGTSLRGHVTATVQGLNLVTGLVTATAVKADVTAAGKPPTLGDNSSFLGLVVNGSAISDPVPPNTKVPLSGIGTLWLHRVIKGADGIKVIMIQLRVTVPSNPAGLAPGTVVNVAVARVGVGG